MEIEILYSDADIAVCVKSAGIISESGGMPELLSAQLGGEFYCVHRLDLEVGGVMVYARSSRAAAVLSGQIASGVFTKEYLCLVPVGPASPEGRYEDLLFHDRQRNKSFVVRRMRRGVKEASLDYRRLTSAPRGDNRLSLLAIRLNTGRTHQIRVQLASRGMPIAGDARYGSALRLRSMALWSARIGFEMPRTGERRLFSAPPPAGRPWDGFEDEINAYLGG